MTEQLWYTRCPVPTASGLAFSLGWLEARYATVGTPRQFWQTWRDEEDRDEIIDPLANRPLTAAEAD